MKRRLELWSLVCAAFAIGWIAAPLAQGTAQAPPWQGRPGKANWRIDGGDPQKNAWRERSGGWEQCWLDGDRGSRWGECRLSGLRRCRWSWQWVGNQRIFASAEIRAEHKTGTGAHGGFEKDASANISHWMPPSPHAGSPGESADMCHSGRDCVT